MSDTDEFCEVGNPRFWEERAFDWKQRAEAAEAEVTRLREALQPFRLFASAVERRFDLDKHLEAVVTIEHQSLVVGAFITARQVLIDGER